MTFENYIEDPKSDNSVRSGDNSDRSARLDIDTWAMKLAQMCAERSTCIRRKAGAIALDCYNIVVGVGYNGVPRDFPHCLVDPCSGAQDKSGDTSRCLAVHAEINAIINCTDSSRIVSVYLTASPCKSCALAIVNLPALKRVFYLEDYPDKMGLHMLVRASICRQINVRKLTVNR